MSERRCNEDRERKKEVRKSEWSHPIAASKYKQTQIARSISQVERHTIIYFINTLSVSHKP